MKRLIQAILIVILAAAQASAIQINDDVLGLPDGAFPPATCEVGEIFFDTDETVDTNCTTTLDNTLCLCTAANTWAELTTGGGSTPTKWIDLIGGGFQPLEPVGDAVAPLGKEEGSNNLVDHLSRFFDAAADEAVGISFVAPSDLDASGTVQFVLIWYEATAAGDDVCFDFRHHAANNDESWNAGSLTVEPSGDLTGINTQDDLVYDTWNDTVANMSWSASDSILAFLYRDADQSGGSCTLDDSASDAVVVHFLIGIPRS